VTDVGSRPSRPKSALPATRVVQPERPPASYVSLRRRLTYHVVPEYPFWLGLDVLVATHQHQAQGILALRVLAETGRVVRHITCDLRQVGDNDWLSIRFDPIVNAASQRFTLEFGLPDRLAGSSVSLYENNRPEKTYRRWLRRFQLITAGNTLHCRMWYAERG